MIIDKILLFLIQLSHWIFLFLITSVPLVLLNEEYYISLPICLIINLGFSRTLDCLGQD